MPHSMSTRSSDLFHVTRRRKTNNFKKIVEMDSENIKAYLKLGQVLRESGNVQKALKIHLRNFGRTSF